MAPLAPNLPSWTSEPCPRQVGLQPIHRHPDRVPNPEVGQLTGLAHPVDRGGADVEEFGRPTHGKERLQLQADLGLLRPPVQQGSSKK